MKQAEFLIKYKYLFLLLASFIIFNCFFLNKAFHIDDPFTIAIANAINKDFFVPAPVFFDNPILLGYYYAPIIKLFGATEIPLHLFYLPFSVLVIVAMYFLSRRFAEKSLLPVIFLISTPAFIVTSQNIMLDIPFLGLFLASTVSFIYGADLNDYKLLAISAMLISATILTKYSGLMLIPLLYIYLLINSKGRLFLFLLIPITVFVFWNIHNIVFYKSFMFYDALLIQLKTFFINDLVIRVFSTLSLLSGTSIITIFLLLFFLRRKPNVVLFLIALPANLFLFRKEMFFSYGSFEKFIIGVFVTFSFFAILLVFKFFLTSLNSRGSNRDNLFLSLWFFIFLVFLVFSNFIAARFILLLLPPLFLLIFRQMFGKRKYPIAFTKGLLIFAFLLTFIFSFLLATGDYSFARAYSDFSQYLKKTIPPGSSVYFYLGDWGYDYYMSKSGYKPLTSNQIKEAMDYRYCRYRLPQGIQIYDYNEMIQELRHKNSIILITPRESAIPSVACGGVEKFLNGIDKLGCSKELVDQRQYYGNIILLNRKLNTGFYSSGHGILPFSIFLRKVKIEAFEVYKLVYKNSGP